MDSLIVCNMHAVYLAILTQNAKLSENNADNPINSNPGHDQLTSEFYEKWSTNFE